MAVDDNYVMVQKSHFDFLRQHYEHCPFFDEQRRGLSDGCAIVIPYRRPSGEPSKKRKTLHELQPQEVSQPSHSSQQPEPQLLLQPLQEPGSQLSSGLSNTSKGKKPKRAPADGPRTRPRKNAAADWFLQNAPKATEWRKRQIELGLNIVEEYKQVIQDFTDGTHVIVEREPYQGEGHQEHELIDLAERFALLTTKSLTNAKLQRSFASFQVLILLSYCEVLRKRDVPYETIDPIIQHVAGRESDRRRLLNSALWINSLIVDLVSHGWTIYRATELFFIDAISTTYLLHIHNNINSQLILERLKTDEFVKHDYSDCLKPEYTIPGLIVSLLDTCKETANSIPINEICAALGYNSDCPAKSVESRYKVHAASKSTPVVSLDLEFQVLVPSSFQSNEGPLISASNSYPTIRASDPRRLYTEGSGQQSITLAPDERATTTNYPLTAPERSISDSAEPQTPPSQNLVAITAPAYPVYSIKTASRALATLLSFFGQFKISECLLERGRGPLLKWGENGEVEQYQVNTVEVVQDKLVCDEAICNLHELKAIRLEQSTAKARYISVDPQVLTRMVYHEDHKKWRIEAVKVVLYAFPIDRRLQPMHSFSIATSILPLLNHVLPYLEEIVVEKALPAAHVVEICLSASYYSTLDWKKNVVATAESIGTRFSVGAQLRGRIELRKKILSRILSCKWGPEAQHLEVTRVDQRSNGYYGEFVLFNADVLFGRQELQAAFDELDRYTPWHPGNVSALEQFQICEISFLRGKIHHFSGHFKEARTWLERVLNTKRPEASMMCKTIAHLAAVCCELGEPRLGIDYASGQFNDLTANQSRESGSAKRLRLALAYAYLMQGMWVIVTQPTASGYTSLQRNIREGFDKAYELFQALAQSYENASTLSRAGKTNRLSTLLGLAVIAHIKDDLYGARRCYDIALDAANHCNWDPGYIEAIIYWSKSVVMHGLGELEEAQKLNRMAGSLYQCRSYFFVGFGTLWPEIIGNWVAQQGGERIVPQQGWERKTPEHL